MSIVSRVHNPSGLRCGCPPECICQRSVVGRALRWYIPGRFHTPVPPERKQLAESQGLSFRSE
jgi:hypothetical protein